MKFSHIELIPSILKPARPTQFDGESFTVLEYVSKNSSKVNECIEAFNGFIDEITAYCSEYVIKTDEELELFQRGLEQKFQDFIRVIELKYKGQDKVIDDAVKYMKDNIVVFIGDTLRNMYDDGQLSEIVVNSVENLKGLFLETVAKVDNKIAQIDSDYATRTEEFTNLTNQLTSDVRDTIDSTEEVIDRTEQVISDARNAINALDITVIELDGKSPGYTEDPTDYNGGLITI